MLRRKEACTCCVKQTFAAELREIPSVDPVFPVIVLSEQCLNLVFCRELFNVRGYDISEGRGAMHKGKGFSFYFISRKSHTL